MEPAFECSAGYAVSCWKLGTQEIAIDWIVVAVQNEIALQGDIQRRTCNRFPAGKVFALNGENGDAVGVLIVIFQARAHLFIAQEAQFLIFVQRIDREGGLADADFAIVRQQAPIKIDS